MILHTIVLVLYWWALFAYGYNIADKGKGADVVGIILYFSGLATCFAAYAIERPTITWPSATDWAFILIFVVIFIGTGLGTGYAAGRVRR